MNIYLVILTNKVANIEASYICRAKSLTQAKTKAKKFRDVHYKDFVGVFVRPMPLDSDDFSRISVERWRK